MSRYINYTDEFSHVGEVPATSQRNPEVPYVEFANEDDITGKDAKRRCLLCSTGWLNGKRQIKDHFGGSKHRKRHRKLLYEVADRENQAEEKREEEARIRNENQAIAAFFEAAKRREVTAAGLTFPYSRALVREKLFLAVIQRSDKFLAEADRVLCNLKRLEIVTLLDLVLFRASVKPQFDNLDEWRGYKALDLGFDPGAWAKGVRATNGSGAVIPLIMERLK